MIFGAQWVLEETEISVSGCVMITEGAALINCIEKEDWKSDSGDREWWCVDGKGKSLRDSHFPYIDNCRSWRNTNTASPGIDTPEVALHSYAEYIHH